MIIGLNVVDTSNDILIRSSNLLGASIDLQDQDYAISYTTPTETVSNLSSVTHVSSDISFLYNNENPSSLRDVSEFYQIGARFHQDDNPYITVHDSIMNYIKTNYNSINDIENKYKDLIVIKVLILLSAVKNSSTDILNYMINSIDYSRLEYYSIKDDSDIFDNIKMMNRDIRDNKENIRLTNKKYELKKHYAYIQEIEFYVILSIVVVIILVAFSFNFDKDKNKYVKMLVIGCIILAVINYIVTYVYNVEPFSGSNAKTLIKVLNNINENSVLSGNQKIYRAISCYMDYLEINLRPKGHVFNDINKRLNMEKSKNKVIKNEIDVANFTNLQQYYDIRRNSRFQMDVIYLVLYIVALTLLLNSWYLEKYSEDMESTVLSIYSILLIIGIFVFLYRINIRARQDGTKFYF